MTNTVDGKHALITGGSRGIGRGIAMALADAGVKIAIHYFQNEAAAKETLAEVRKRGSDGILVQADVMVRMAVQRDAQLAQVAQGPLVPVVPVGVRQEHSVDVRPGSADRGQATFTAGCVLRDGAAIILHRLSLWTLYIVSRRVAGEATTVVDLASGWRPR